ncbi:MAG: DNA repair protein RecO [Patescibacteria group bacterium]|nr:DNA repair protein RecO [Patescibacteria group bacterium]
MQNLRFIKSEGIVISRTNYKEGDRLVKLFSKNYGKITLLARGARKTRSRKRGSIEVFSRLKFSAYRKDGVGVLTETFLIDSYPDIRKNIRKVALSYFLLEVVNNLTRIEERSDSDCKVYELLVSTFEGIRKRKDLRNIKKEFSTEILSILGFWNKSKLIDNPEHLIRSLTERELNSVRVGRSLIF